MKILSEKYLFSYSACRTIIYLILQFGKYFLAKHCQTVHFLLLFNPESHTICT